MCNEPPTTTGSKPVLGQVLHVRIDARPHVSEQAVLCVHGVTQNGCIFKPMADRLSARGVRVAAIDLRGHGESLREPPWNIATHVDDLRLTADSLGIKKATWVGHSFGASIIASLALAFPEIVDRLVLLDPPSRVPASYALRQAELHCQDWSFQTIDGAINALLSTENVVSAPRTLIADYVRSSVKEGPDGRLRFSFSPAAIAVAWSEMTQPTPVVADVPTLIVRAEESLVPRDGDSRHHSSLGDDFRFVEVPHGHNMMWDSPAETIAAIERFLDEAT